MERKYKKVIKNKTILVTGGTGSFGSIVAEKFLKLKPKRVIILSRDEKKQFDMRNKYDSPLLKFIIGDVRDRETIENAMYGVDYVFHAAALKQVPTCEFFPMEAIKTNVLGTHNVIQAAIKNKVQKVIVLSTDKAVYPINALGLSKAMMEKVMIAESKNFIEKGRNETTLCGVRYGNVLYTRGSVLPFFVRLIRQKKEIIVTHPDMTRFLLPLSVSVELVLYALEEGQNGFIYVRKAPACTIKTLAEAVCKIFNYTKKFIEVGIRAGEKMHETLVTREEILRAQEVSSYYKIPSESQGLDYNKYFYQGERVNVKNIEPFTSENTTRLNVSETIKLLLKLPEIQQELRFNRQ